MPAKTRAKQAHAYNTAPCLRISDMFT